MLLSSTCNIFLKYNDGRTTPAELENVTKKLFQTPFPKCTAGQGSKYVLNYAPKSSSKSRTSISASKDMFIFGEKKRKIVRQLYSQGKCHLFYMFYVVVLFYKI